MVAVAPSTALPASLGRVMRNVAVTVDHDTGPSEFYGLGLYRGVPLTRRTSHYSGVLPDRIIIYRQAICRPSATVRAEVVDQARRTVVHEVGHHFESTDGRLHELGWWRQAVGYRPPRWPAGGLPSHPG